jgi:hypothetical protein
MEKEKKKLLTVELAEPEYTSMRELAKILRTINNLYNYYALLCVPRIKEKLEARLKTSRTKRPKTLLYSSALEDLMKASDKMNVIKISSESPIRLTVRGIREAIDGLTDLLRLFSNIYEIMKSLRKKDMLDVEYQKLINKEQELKNFEKSLDIIAKVHKLKIPKKLKEKVQGTLLGNMRRIERSDIKPIFRHTRKIDASVIRH